MKYLLVMEQQTTKFCEDCPLRGRAIGKLEYTGSGEAVKAHKITGKEIAGRTNVGFLLDTDLNASEPIRMLLEDEDIYDRIDSCEGPAIFEEKRLFRKPKLVTTCPAIGRLAIEPGTELYNLVTRQAAL